MSGLLGLRAGATQVALGTGKVTAACPASQEPDLLGQAKPCPLPSLLVFLSPPSHWVSRFVFVLNSAPRRAAAAADWLGR